MATYNGKYRVKNSKNSYDTIYLETSAEQVKFSDGTSFQEKLDKGLLKGDKGEQGIQGAKGDKGSDGLTTSVTVNGIKYTHSSGNITLPNYPTLSSIGAEPKNANIQAHISSAHAPSDAQKNSDITKSEIEAKLTGNINTHTHSEATATTSGLMSATDKTKLDGVAIGANKYVHPTNHPASIITQDTNNRFVTDTEKSNWNAKETTSGSQSKADKAKTDAIASAKSYTDTKVAGLVNSAPETLDTLNELSKALGDDPNFATTVSNKIGTKADITYVNTELGKKANIQNPSFVGNVTANNFIGNASTSTKWSKSISITLDGVVEGEAMIDGSDNIVITTSAADIVEIAKTLRVTTDWMDVGISGENLDTGTYAIQMHVNNGTNTKQYNEYYSGMMSWYNSTTNSSESDEIVLHKAGHAPNGNHLYLRTARSTSGGYLKLQIASTNNFSAETSIVFKFKKLI